MARHGNSMPTVGMVVWRCWCCWRRRCLLIFRFEHSSIIFVSNLQCLVTCSIVLGGRADVCVCRWLLFCIQNQNRQRATTSQNVIANKHLNGKQEKACCLQGILSPHSARMGTGLSSQVVTYDSSTRLADHRPNVYERTVLWSTSSAVCSHRSDSCELVSRRRVHHPFGDDLKILQLHKRTLLANGKQHSLVIHRMEMNAETAMFHLFPPRRPPRSLLSRM